MWRRFVNRGWTAGGAGRNGGGVVPAAVRAAGRRSTGEQLLGRAAELRAAFDEAFAEPPRASHGPLEDLLVIEVGGALHAVRLAQVAAVVIDRPVTPLPVSCPQLLGLVGHTGALVAAFDLAALLGLASSADPRWLLLTAEPSRVAFAFDGVVGRLRRPTHGLRADDSGQSAVAFEGNACPVLSMPSLIDSVAELGRGAPPKEY